MKDREGNFWERRNNLERILIVVVVVLLCFVFSLFVVLLIQYGRFFKPESAVCSTPHCIKAAAQIVDFIDPSIEPCDDFYAFACGNFLKRSIETNQITALSNLEAITAHQIDALITEPTTEPLPKSLQLQRKFYESCLNTTTNEEDTLQLLIEKLGGWPVLKGVFWNDVQFNWLTSMVKARRLGTDYEYFMRVTGTAEANDTELFIISISPPVRHHLAEEFEESYIDLMANISILFGAPTNKAKNEFFRVLQFDKQLQTFIEKQERNGEQTILELRQLKREFPHIPWIDFLNNITITSTRFNEATLVHLKAKLYLQELQKLLKSTSKTVLANYVIWRTVETLHNYLNATIRDSYNSFLMTINRGVTISNIRNIFCLNEAKLYFPSVAETAYVRKYLRPENRLDIEQMAESIRLQLANKIKTSDWLDDSSKVSSESKLNDTEVYVGSSDRAFHGNFDEIVEMEEIDLSTDSIIDMVTRLSAKKADNYFRMINRNYGEVRQLALDKASILKINAFYAQKLGTLILPAPLLQGIMYDFHRPQYMNFGAIGSVIGHEFTHGLMEQGNDTEILWPIEVMKKYKNKIQCLVEEYQNYSDHLEGFTNDGKVALQENLADLIGPNLAYEAYQEWIRNHNEERTLPGIKYSPNQIFWITFAAFKCYQPRLRHVDSNDPEHGVPSFAVTSSLKNSPHFAHDFNCPTGSNMNPAKKCQVL